MDKKKSVIRAGAVLVVALAAGHLVQTMTAERSVAEAPRPTDVQPVSAGADATLPVATSAIPAAASLGAPIAPEPAPVAMGVPEPQMVTTGPAQPQTAADAPIPVALPATPEDVATEQPAALPATLPEMTALPEMAEQPLMQDSAEPQPTTPALAEADCTNDMVLTAGSQAMISVAIFAPCRAGERVVLRHGGIAVAETLAPDGALTLDFPALDAGGEVSVLFADAAVLRGSVPIPDATKRFAVQWMGDDAFQLHAFENGAEYGQPGDVNAGAPVSPSGGYMISLGNPTLDFPMMAEIYTHPADATVAVDLVIEAAVTDLTCGRELLGEVVQAADGARTVNDLTLAMPDCDAVGDILVLNNPGQDVTLAAAN